MKLTLGFSPCPNDTFIFDALVNGKIDTGDFEFEVIMEDVETLNRWALEGKLDITKLSYHAYAHCARYYQVLNAGSALGNNCGPLFISSPDKNSTDYSDLVVAVPGELTTAHFLFSLFYPQVKLKKFMVFSDIESAILNHEVDAGVIIHENRFTYEQKGLKKIADLGELWEQTTHYPIPLGGIMIKRNISEQTAIAFNHLLNKSIQYAFDNKSQNSPYVTEHAQEMSNDVIYKHITTYVNTYSLDLNTKGQDAIEHLYKKAVEINIIKPLTYNIFLHKYLF